jgi:hypothetical protein
VVDLKTPGRSSSLSRDRSWCAPIRIHANAASLQPQNLCSTVLRSIKRRFFFHLLLDHASLTLAQFLGAVMKKFAVTISFISFGIASLIVPLCGAQAQVNDICHGEYSAKCKIHPFSVQEVCTKYNGVGDANPKVSCQKLCGAPLGPKCLMVRLQAPIAGDFCGYSWFRITCLN